jgi:hypothetical protein
MDLGRLGGVLVIAGWVLIAATITIFGAGNSVQIGGDTIGGLALAASLGVIGGGMAVLSLTGPRPLQGRIMRLGLGFLAVGLLGSLASTVIAAGLEYDPLENGPFVITFLVGALATTIGVPVTVLSLVRTSGPTRTVGLLFLAGLVCVFLGSVVRSNAAPDGHPVPEIGLAFIVGGAIGIALAGAALGALPWTVARTERAAAP